MDINITVFVLSYCRPLYLAESVSSLLALNLSKDQIIILDNGSPQELMENFLEEYSSFVTWIGSQKNNGVAWNLKRAFSLANKKYFMVLHDDDCLIEHSIEEQLIILNKNPSLAAISSNGYIIDSSGMRNGSLVLPNMPKQGVRYFYNSSQIAAHVYGDSCIPFSPTIYRTSAVKIVAENIVSWSSHFGPVADVILQMELADSIGPIGLNFEPLYECRKHLDQDSTYIDEIWNRRLREYCTQLCRGSNIELKAIKKQIPKAYTFTFVYHLIKSIFSLKFSNTLRILCEVDFSYFSLAGCIYFLKRSLIKLLRLGN
jgi:glycosyltransferase involved in cell wall biosynthesis